MYGHHHSSVLFPIKTSDLHLRNVLSKHETAHKDKINSRTPHILDTKMFLSGSSSYNTNEN